MVELMGIHWSAWLALRIPRRVQGADPQCDQRRVSRIHHDHRRPGGPGELWNFSVFKEDERWD